MDFKLFYPPKQIDGSEKLFYEKEKSGIYLYHHANGKRYKYGLGITVSVKNWNIDKQRARSVKGYELDSTIINDQLDNASVAFSNYEQKCKRLGQPLRIENIKHEVDLALGRIEPVAEKAAKKLSLVELAEQYLDSNPHKLVQQTVRTKRSSVQAIKEYNNKFPSKPVDFDTIDIETRTSFINYFEQDQVVIKPDGEAKIIPGRTPNTLWKYIKDLKTFLRYAEEEKSYEVNQAYKRRGFSPPQEEVDDVYLSPEELEQLNQVDLTKQPKSYRLVLDVFMVGCNTGLRISDIVKLQPEKIKKENGRLFIHTLQQKTGDKVIIPVKQTIVPIIEKLPFQYISTQHVNRSIKKIAELAELDKAPEISSHTARRSFATNAYIAGMNPTDIRAITGHKTELSFLRYLKITKEETAKAISYHPFMQ